MSVNKELEWIFKQLESRIETIQREKEGIVRDTMIDNLLIDLR